MTAPAISRFAIPDLDSLPQDLIMTLKEVEEKAGFIPNIFLALAHRPAEFRAFFAYHDALMERDTGLTKAERELIVVATSGINQCQYCVVAHGAILRIRAKDPLIADQVAVNWRKTDLTARQKAMLTYAEKVALEAQHITDADHQALYDAGFDADEVWDIGAIAAFFAMSNRLVNAGDIRPNPQFFMLGRQ